jgi:homocysteine S-methyltransferase
MGARLELETPLATHPLLGILPLVDDPVGRMAIRAVLSTYVAVGDSLGLPTVIDAPVWWGRPHHFAKAGWTQERANRCLVELVELTAAVAGPHVVSAAFAPATDGYLAGKLTPVDAYDIHAPVVEVLAQSSADYLMAATFSTTEDLLGAGKALAGCGRPFVLGPTVSESGALPDGRPLAEVIEEVESQLPVSPAFWALCCVHPSDALMALRGTRERSSAAAHRVRQVKGNGVRASASERDAATSVLSDPPEAWGESAYRLKTEGGVSVLGGCCGTDDRHLLSLGLRMAQESAITS